MKLSNLSHFIDPVILARGRDYFRSGNVHLLEEVGDLIFRSEVQGSEIYEVSVEIDKDGAVLSSDCDCLYDYGPVCKHQAAVLLKLYESMTVVSTPKNSDIEKSADKDLEKLLMAETKESLITLILSLVAESDLVEQRVKLYVSKNHGNGVVEEFRKMIRSYTSKYANEFGFVTWRDAHKVMKAVEMVAQKAREAAAVADWIGAMRINLCIMEEIVEMLQIMDDSDGSVGCLIEDCFERIREITMESESIQQAEHETIFRLLLEASVQSRFEGWTDWQLELLENASRLAITADRRKEWDEHAAIIIAENKEDTWSENYIAERVAMMQYDFIQGHDGEDQAREFLNNHLDYSSFREAAIRHAVQRGDYGEVIRLAEEGEALDQAKGLPGLVKQWKEHRYNAYEISGKKESMRKLGEELLMNGEYSYYQKIKDSYPADEWRPVYQNILSRLGEKNWWFGDIYTRIILEERETALLLEYVTKKPEQIEAYYPYLQEEFPEQVKQLFLEYIVAKADQSSTRKQYWNVCRIIRIIQKVSGKKAAAEIATMLFEKYPKRSAFRDELLKLNY